VCASGWEDSSGGALPGLAATGTRVLLTVTTMYNADGVSLRGGWYEGLGTRGLSPDGGALNIDGAFVSVVIRDSHFVGCKATVAPHHHPSTPNFLARELCVPADR
jgi:hypothetical protein